MVKFSLSIEGLDCGLNPVSYAVLTVLTAIASALKQVTRT